MLTGLKWRLFTLMSLDNAKEISSYIKRETTLDIPGQRPDIWGPPDMGNEDSLIKGSSLKVTQAQLFFHSESHQKTWPNKMRFLEP